MARWREDDVDVACASWALQWVENFQRDPDRAGRYVGALGCTLGRVMERHDGAGSSTERARHFPEVFLGQGLEVAIALKAMSEMQRRVLWQCYVGRWYDPTTWKRLPRPVKNVIVAHCLGLSLAEFYHRRDTAKACVRVALTLDTKELASARGLVVSSAQVA